MRGVLLGGVLLFFLHTYAWAKHLLPPPPPKKKKKKKEKKKKTGISSTAKILDFFAIQNNILILYIYLMKRPENT